MEGKAMHVGNLNTAGEYGIELILYFIELRSNEDIFHTGQEQGGLH